MKSQLALVCVLCSLATVCQSSNNAQEFSHSAISEPQQETGKQDPSTQDSDPRTAEKNDQPQKLESQHLPNLVQVHQRVISGGLPEGEEAFAELAQRGIKTIISVDGMTPEVQLAEKYGMTYVHLPHGYDGIPSTRVWELAKAIQTCDGPIYIHCHHGKHRSPAAASVACVSAGLIAADKAVRILELAGTNPNYRGLFASAAAAKPLDADSLKQFSVTFQSVQEIPPMATAMVQLSHIHDHLKLIEKHNWSSPPDHPDLDPAHEVLLLRELVTELSRTEEVKQLPAEFQDILGHTEKVSLQLEDQLRLWSTTKSTSKPLATESNSNVPKSVGKLFLQIGQDCKSCHAKFRDIPLGEK